MAPHLRPEVIAAIETAVDCHDGALESAFIHSLAKIYKTSPQAIVYNMKRHKKVKANMDDRQSGGRPAAMDKDKAAEATREFIAECPGIKTAGICPKLHERFDKEVSTTWVARLIQRYKIVHREPKPPKVKGVRIPKVSKQVTHSQSADQAPVYAGYTGTTPQYQLPAESPNAYPSFREDLQRAIVAPRLPPVEGQSVPPQTIEAWRISTISSNRARSNYATSTCRPISTSSDKQLYKTPILLLNNIML